ncbi:hypothetical protein K458DRAFT_413356 [Lentithecium fluviatile CBS 122367]|uniref:F-box domain-containing protein n=1 Tax=Lentithecium fluviatile CBS 122367 TaxID=1168545 RepID=A0A6G1JEP2_9PLEO|nr:hypothetical protein K458DRAFT_413356 [Lentithecium fluviatile CBS 122367]
MSRSVSKPYAMHRALIPEIVAQIIDCNRSYPGYLYTCLLINSLFFHSTARILWYGCGVGSSTKGHITPYICHLVQISRRDTSRGQLYASLIKLLRVSDGIVAEQEVGVMVGQPDGNEHVYFEELGGLGLEWTSLEELDMAQWAHTIEERGGILMQYLQPSLRKLVLCRSPVGDGWLEMLGERCPRLKVLVLKPSVLKNGMSKDGLARFLRKCKVEYLDLRAEEQEWDRGLTEGMLEVLRTQGNLREIAIPDIDDDTIKQMANGQRATDNMPFPALKSLRTGLSASGLHSLYCVTPRLSILSLDLRRLSLSASTSILPSVSIFSQLSTISITFDKRVRIRGDELIHLAQSCPSLVSLSISKDQLNTTRPWSRDIQDSHIEAFARNAVHLKELYLLFRVPQTAYPGEIWPTEVALESLARHCVHLERLWLTCDPNWDNLVWNPLRVLFPKVWDLQIAGPELRFSLGVLPEDILRDMAKEFAARCPELIEFRFLYPYGEEPLDERIRDVLYIRR